MSSFDKFIKSGVVKIQSPDIERAESLVLESERKMRQIKRNTEKIGIDKENANDIIEACYDSVIYLIRAIMLSKGLSASGKGAHEAEVYFLEELSFKEDEINFMDKLRYFRNGIMYYGKRFEEEYAKKTLDFANKSINKLNNFLPPRT